MGMEDRDWYKDVLKERAQKERNVRPFKRSTPHTMSKGKVTPLLMLMFWLVVLYGLYSIAHLYLKPKPIVISATGDVVIPRNRDGHFYATGVVAGKPVNFLVDTGASMVTISEQFARKAGISTSLGVPTIFKTANGDIQGRILSNVPVSLGPIDVSGVNVAIGLVGHKDNDALLGQSFLSKFDVVLQKDQMLLRQRQLQN
ncbi:MAG: TIGR02281 family clan AA aspartic protease [Pseudomonadota bacterium]